MTDPRSDRLGHALTAVREAARVCRWVQQDLDRLRAMTKDDRSPVTIADYASQAVVARALASSDEAAGARLVAEESAEFLKAPEHAAHLAATAAALRDSGVWPHATEADVLDAVSSVSDPPAPGSGEAWWTLDPIDGTKGFVRGQQYAVALACLVNGRVALGLMACPNLSIDHEASVEAADPRGTMYLGAASAGGGAAGLTEWVLGRLDGQRLPARMFAPGQRGGPVLAESVDAGHSDQTLSGAIMHRAFGEHRTIRLDSQAKYAVVARGQADVYLRLPTRRGYVERIWDHAAGSIIAEQAGCTVTDIRGRALDFSRGRGLESNLGVVVAPPELHGRLIEVIEEMGLGRDASA